MTEERLKFFFNKGEQLPYLDKAEEDFAWHTRSVDQIFFDLKTLPNFRFPNLSSSNAIAVLSDYSGEHRSSPWKVYSFLVVDYHCLELFTKQTTAIRSAKKMDSPYKEMAFKSLSYGPAQKALPEWLGAADQTLPGLVLNLMVDKSMQSLAGSKEELQELQMIMAEQNYSSWASSSVEKVMTVLHLVGYLFGLLSGSESKLFWMTDDDAIVANGEKMDEVRKMLRNVVALYSKGGPPRPGGMATPFREDMDSEIKFTDALSLADLAAGAVSHFFEKRPKKARLKPGTAIVTDWLSHSPGLLQKFNFYIRQKEDGQASIGSLKFDNEVSKWEKK